MSRRKKLTVAEPSAAEQPRPLPEPNPPKPNRLLLVVSGLVLAVWIIFLIVLATTT